MMRASDDLNDDERGLLDEKWVLRKEENRWRIWIACLLCLLSGFALGTLFDRAWARDEKSSHANADLHVPTAPIAPSLKVEFQPNEIFQRAAPGPEADGLWDTLMPLRRGFVQVKPNGDLVGSSETPAVSETKVVAAFHQMNCLNMLRKSLYTSVTKEHTSTAQIKQMEHHWKHCFDYLRQSLMCNADVTLEKIDTSGDVLGSVNGWGTEHVCRNWEDLKLWAEGGSRYPDSRSV